jgi:hypothetical protein
MNFFYVCYRSLAILDLQILLRFSVLAVCAVREYERFNF